MKLVSITSTINECRDARDNCFLRLATDGAADVVVAGDEDLLTLDPFHSIRTVSARAFLKLISEGEGLRQ